MKRRAVTRRTFLEVMGVGAGAIALRQSLLSGEAHAQTAPEPKFLLLVYMGGGWDQLLALDPRDQTDPLFTRTEAYKPTGSGIFPAYEDAAAEDAIMRAILNTTPTGNGGVRTGVQTLGNLTFGPAVPPSLLAHAADFSIVRGMTMNTLTHEVGRRYLLTGKLPRGIAPNGSSLGTVVAGLQPNPNYNLPHLAVAGIEAYNEGWPAGASPIPVRDAADMRDTLGLKGAALKDYQLSAITQYEATADSCAAHGYDMRGLLSAFRDSREKAKLITDPALVANFNFSFPAPTSAVQTLYANMGIAQGLSSTSPKWKAAVAAQALTTGISQAVAVQLVSDLDDHFDWAGTHSVSLLAGFDALGALIKHLKATPAPAGAVGKSSFWECTSMLVFSEFSRTPLINGRGGRDHHLASSCLLAGPGIRRGAVFGATTNKDMSVTRRNFANNAEDAAGQAPKPSDIHATLLKSMGLDHSHLSNQDPKIIDYLLR